MVATRGSGSGGSERLHSIAIKTIDGPIAQQVCFRRPAVRRNRQRRVIFSSLVINPSGYFFSFFFVGLKERRRMACAEVLLLNRKRKGSPFHLDLEHPRCPQREA